jgi:hypothetical protein
MLLIPEKEMHSFTGTFGVFGPWDKYIINRSLFPTTKLYSFFDL